MNPSGKIWLFFIPALIWGSTWYAITFQIGKVDPLVSVAYRFSLAGIILLTYCYFKKESLRFSLKEHFFLFLQGVFLYGLNYWLVYLAETTVASGLVAIIFSLIVVLNIVFANLFLKTPVKKKLIVSAILGITGTVVVFLPELHSIGYSGNYFLMIIVCLISVVLASLGNIIASYNNKKHNIPVLQANALGMTYGAIVVAILAVILGKPFDFDFSIKYIGSLFYLAIFGSVIAFNTYISLIALWGPGKAAYSVLVTPIIAVIISSIFEDYNFSVFTLLGAALVVFGNYLVIRKEKS